MILKYIKKGRDNFFYLQDSLATRKYLIVLCMFHDVDYFGATSNSASLVVLGIIDTKFYGFKGPRLYTARGGKIAKEDSRFEPSHDPLTISEDAFVEDVEILPRA